MPDTRGDETRPSLLFRVRDPRDVQAWDDFARVYRPLVYGHARRRGLSHEDAEDVAQRVFARVCAAIRGFEYQPDKGRFRDWLGSIVRNEVFRHWKKEEKLAQGHGGDDSALEQVAGDAVDPEWAAEYHSFILQTALARCQPHFEPSTWRAFERVWLEQRPAPEVATELGQPIDWVYVAKSRVLKRLWQEVQELAEDVLL
jgi:RNA polymerase sigma factor (sigma-70 family)